MTKIQHEVAEISQAAKQYC